MRRNWWLSALCVIIVLGANVGLSQFASGHVDFDDCGLWRNYNTDDSREKHIKFDTSDDTIRKAFYISYIEYDLGHRVNLWVYAKCWGVQSDTTNPTHQIRILKPSGMAIARNFICYKVFSYDEFHWQMFEFDVDYLASDCWIRVEIEDVSSYTVNNIEIGIDTSYGHSPENPITGTIIQDWDQSYWSSNGAGVTPDEENEIVGELMIKLEVASKQTDRKVIPLDFDYSTNYYPYTFIPLDDYNDKIRWRCFDITQNDIDNSVYARLYIWGYSWIVGEDPPSTTNRFTIKVNNNQYFYNPDEYWIQKGPIGHWYYFDFNPQGNLVLGTNTFEIKDISADFQRHNLKIIYFTDIDNDRSAWYYNKGQGPVGDPNLDSTKCTGELGIYLFLYKEKCHSTPTVGGINLWCEDHDDHCAWNDSDHESWSTPVGSRIANNLEGDHSWYDALNRLDDTSEGMVYEGYFSKEGWFPGAGYIGGDSVDLLIYEGHAFTFGGMTLPDHDFQNRWTTTSSGLWDDFDIYWTVDDELETITGKPETDNWDWSNDAFYGYSEDGLNWQADWILLFGCELLAGYNALSPLDRDSPWLTMLYHGVHMMMGFATPFGGTTQERNSFSDGIVENWCDDDMTVFNGFIDAVVNGGLPSEDDGEPWNRFIIYYHQSNYNGHLYHEGTVSNDFDFNNGYEDRDICCYVDPRGLDVN